MGLILSTVFEERGAVSINLRIGETFKNFNQQIKGNKRKLIQFGVPVFGQIKGEVPNIDNTKGETFKNFNQQIKGNKRELIQFGVPVFGQIKWEVPSKQEKHYIEPIPSLLQDVIDHLNQWCLIPNKKPNSCIINFFDEVLKSLVQ